MQLVVFHRNEETLIANTLCETIVCSYFAEPSDEADMVEQDILFKRIMEESIAFHLWNGITSSLVPEPKSLVERILNHFCLRCLDVI